MKTEYEILYILKPHLGEDQYKELVQSFQGWVTENEGEILLHEVLGLRELSSEMKKLTEGYYVQCQFKGTNATLDEIDHRIRVNDGFLRHLIVTMESITYTTPPPRKPRTRSRDAASEQTVGEAAS